MGAETWSREREAERLGVSLGTLDKLVKIHRLPVLRAGRRVLFDEVAHVALVERIRCQKDQQAQDSASSAEKGRRLSTSEARSKASSFSKLLALPTHGGQTSTAHSARRNYTPPRSITDPSV